MASNLGGSVLAASGADSGPSTIKNSIFYFNAGTIVKTGTSLDPQVTYSIVQNGYEGTGNIDVDPLFVDISSGDYRLSGYSPAIGMGSTSGAPSTDVSGVSRPSPANTNPDAGAYESSQSSQRPKAGSIADGLGNDVDWSNSASSLSANWSAFTDNDTQLSYEYAVGSESEVDILIDNYALSFDGSDDYVSTGISSLDLGGATSLTIEFTIKINSGGKYQGIVDHASNNARFGVILQNNNWLQLSFIILMATGRTSVQPFRVHRYRGGTLSKYLLAKIR